MADLKIVISALNKASGDLNKVKQDISGIKSESETGGGAVEGFGGKLEGLMGKALIVAGAVAGVAAAIGEVYESAKEAAELDYARDKFDALSEAIGTTSSLLLNDMREATSGLKSDAELIEGAGQIMALGLADSHEEVLRLATVAGELDMNMNQLVLTLTNQTTMRFDALGVSVAGFDEKVKALEASGMSASEAFSEAFLQQAEEQIRKVGSVADSSVGSFALMEAGMKNLGDASKANLLDTVEPAISGIAKWMSELGTSAQNENAFKNMVEDMEAAGLSTLKFKQAVYLLRGEMGNISDTERFAELLVEEEGNLSRLKTKTDEWASSNYEGADAAREASAAVDAMTGSTDEMTEATKKAAEEQAKLKEQLDGVTSLDNNYRGIIKLAEQYTDILDEIADIQEQMKDPDLGAEEYTELEGKLEDLKGTMTELANQVTLDMFQATIAVGGVTEAELAAYFQMAIDMGLISEEGAQAAMDAYGSAIETINGYKIDDKTGNVIIDAAEAYATLVMIQQMQIADKTGNIDIFVKYHGTTPSGGYDPYENYTGPGGAVGMAVQGGNPYTWQEYGYKGELFVPSSDGYILSRADAERALSKALTTGGDGMDAEAIGKAVAKAIANVVSGKSGGGNVYNLIMPTSSNPADVRTAFELMEAWGA